jgi:hypothetical protein
LLTVYPAESFELIRLKIHNTLHEARSRDTYRCVCDWLLLARNIENVQDQLSRLVHEIYNRKPALPALKEEMRKAGVVE